MTALPEEEVFQVVASEDVGKLGLVFMSLPPGHIEVKSVSAGSWAADQDIVTGDLLVEAQGRDLESVSDEDFRDFTQQRPLTLVFLASDPDVQSKRLARIAAAEAAKAQAAAEAEAAKAKAAAEAQAAKAKAAKAKAAADVAKAKAAAEAEAAKAKEAAEMAKAKAAAEVKAAEEAKAAAEAEAAETKAAVAAASKAAAAQTATSTPQPQAEAKAKAEPKPQPRPKATEKPAEKLHVEAAKPAQTPKTLQAGKDDPSPAPARVKSPDPTQASRPAPAAPPNSRPTSHAADDAEPALEVQPAPPAASAQVDMPISPKPEGITESTPTEAAKPRLQEVPAKETMKHTESKEALETSQHSQQRQSADKTTGLEHQPLQPTHSEPVPQQIPSQRSSSSVVSPQPSIPEPISLHSVEPGANHLADELAASQAKLRTAQAERAALQDEAAASRGIIKQLRSELKEARRAQRDPEGGEEAWGGRGSRSSQASDSMVRQVEVSEQRLQEELDETRGELEAANQRNWIVVGRALQVNMLV